MYLTKDEKQRHVAEWAEKRERFKSYGLKADEDTAGTGYPDLGVYDLTDRLNEIEGVCTTQSCSGHPRIEGKGKKERKWSAPGQLWLRLDKFLFYEVVSSVQAFVRNTSIEEVLIRWGRERSGPIVEINFLGLNVGAEAFKISSDIIVDWMMTLEAERREE